MTGIVELPSYVPGSPEWHEQRRRAIGGSEIAAILGIGKYESRFSLWHRKAGTLGPQEDNPSMEWGRRLEPVLLAKYAENHGPIEVGGTFTRTDRPWQIASTDARHQGGIVEAKVQHDDRDHEWGEPGSDEVPVYFRSQVTWYMDVLDARWADIAVLIGTSDYREYRVPYDPAEAAFMRAEAEAFLASLESGERPNIDTHQATYQAVRELHPDIEPVKVELPAGLARDYCIARHSLKAADEEAARMRSLVADFMGSAQYATFLGQTIARRQAKGSGKPFVVAGDDLPNFEKAA